MSRRSSKKLNVQNTAVDNDGPTITPKKGRKVVPVQTTTVITEIKTTSKAKPKKQVISDVDTDDEPLSAAVKQTATSRKINRVRAKTVPEEEEVPKKATAKRKAKVEKEDVDRKAPKKRKTKEEKEAETMPLATRTLVGTLKKAMRIGAHVSGAGGNC